MKRLGIYVQVPFCQTKCTYCNFHTGVVARERFAPYVEAVCKEIRDHRELLRTAMVLWGSGENEEAKYLVDTMYFGGGTPSLLDAELLKKIVYAIRQTFASGLEEVPLEADPETVDEEKAAAWVAAGINRVSFGVQSFSDKELGAAGGGHRRGGGFRGVA